MTTALVMLAFGGTAANAAWQEASSPTGIWGVPGPITAVFGPTDTTFTGQSVWIAEAAHPVSLRNFNVSGSTELGSIAPSNSSAEGDLDFISGVAYDSITGAIYVSDQGNQRLLEYEQGEGGYFSSRQLPGLTVTESGCPGGCPEGSAAVGEFDEPAGLAIDSGNLFVADTDNARIQLFDLADLSYVESIQDEGWASSVREPTDIAINPLDGHRFVAVNSADRVEEHDASNALIETYGSGDADGGIARHIALDHINNVLYIVKSNSIDAYDITNGELIQAEITGSTGSAITGIEVDPGNRTLWYSVSGGSQAIRRWTFDAAPACDVASATTDEGVATSVELNCDDAESESSVEYEIVSQPASGTITAFDQFNGIADYQPNLGFSGSDSFTYRARSQTGASQAQTATITVTADPVIPPKPPTGGGSSVAANASANAAAAKPVIRSTANLELSSGDIYVKLPGSDAWVKLEKNALVPVGTIIDAANGYCVLTFANADESLYQGTFWGGVFQILQDDGPEPYAILKLRDDEFPGAPSQAGQTASTSSIRSLVAAAFKPKSKAAAKKGKKKNKLWGKGKGKFRTSGDGSSASVRGTRWGVTNYTNGTVTQVTEGVVVVRDFYLKKNVTLRRGQSYFANKNGKRGRTTARANPRFTG